MLEKLTDEVEELKKKQSKGANEVKKVTKDEKNKR